MATTNAGAIAVSITADSAQFESSMDRSAAAAERMSQRTQRAQAAAQAQGDKFVQSIQRQVDSFGLSGTALLRYEASLKGVSAQAEPLIARLERMKDAQAAFAAEASKGVGKAGFDDAAAGADGAARATSGLTRELLVLGHEASQGNYKRLGGSLLVLAEYSTVAQKAISAMFGPLGAAAAVVALLGAAAVKGALDFAAFEKSLQLTGNFAGTTRDNFDALAKSLSSGPSQSLGTFRAALAEVVATGRFTSDSIASVTRAVGALHDLTGKDTSEIVKDFEGMSGGVTKWATEHNAQMHYASAAEIELIRTLESLGKTQDAIRVNADALTAAMKKQVPEVGNLERSWDAVKKAIGNATQAAMDYGKPDALGKQLTDAQTKLANLREQASQAKGGVFGDVFDVQGQADAQQKVVDNLKARVDLANVAAYGQSRVAQDEAKKIYEADTAYQSAATSMIVADFKRRAAEVELARQEIEQGIQRGYESGNVTLAGYLSWQYKLRKAALQDQLALIATEQKAESSAVVSNPADALSREAKLVEIGTRRIAVLQQLNVLEEQNRKGELQPKQAVDANVATPSQQFHSFEHAHDAETEAAYNERNLQYDSFRTRLLEQTALVDKEVAKINAETASIGMSNEARAEAVAVAKLQSIADTTLLKSGADRTEVEKWLEAAIRKTTGALQAQYQASRSASAGFADFFGKYQEGANDQAKNASAIAGNLVGGLENQLTALFSGQKTNFHSLVDSMIAEVNRLYVVKPLLANIFGSDGTNGSGGSLITTLVGLASNDFGGGSGMTIDTAGAGVNASAAGYSSAAHYAQGTNYVPNDGPAYLHKGEAVVPANLNAANGGKRSGHTFNVSVNAQQGMSSATAMQQGRDIGAGIRQAMSRND